MPSQAEEVCQGEGGVSLPLAGHERERSEKACSLRRCRSRQSTAPSTSSSAR